MKKITKKLSMKYVKLHKSRLRQEGSIKPEEDVGGELSRGTNSPENIVESNNNETKEMTPKVTKIIESMHRKLMLKEKKNIHVDGQDQSQGHERSVKTNHMDHLEDMIIKGRDRYNMELGGSTKNGQRGEVEESSNKVACDFGSKKDYLDWIEYVEGSNHHCFDRSENFEKDYIKGEIDDDNDLISVGISEGSLEGGANEEILLLNISSKHRKNDTK
ncbi:unnamed protein product [Cochlearia groenlandica]